MTRLIALGGRSAVLLLLLAGMMLGADAVAQSPPAAQLGDQVGGAGWTLTVRSIERLQRPLPGPAGPMRAGGQFVVLVVDLRNDGARPAAPVAADFLLTTADARFLNRADDPAAVAYAASDALASFRADIAPGATTTTLLLFDATPGAGRFTLNWKPSGRTIRLVECHCSLPSPSDPFGTGSP